jgi:hypothetical protein
MEDEVVTPTNKEGDEAETGQGSPSISLIEDEVETPTNKEGDEAEIERSLSKFQK